MRPLEEVEDLTEKYINDEEALTLKYARREHDKKFEK